MSELASITFLAGGLLGLSTGFMAGMIWRGKAHIADLRSHIRFVEDYSTAVAKLLDDTAQAVLTDKDGAA